MIEMFGTEAVVYGPKELSWVTAGGFCQSVARVVALHPKTIVIDLAHVEFCDSTGLHALMQTAASTQMTLIRNVPSAVRAAEEESGLQLRHPRTSSRDTGPRHLGPFWV